MGTTWRLRSGTTTAKGKKRMFGFMTDFLNSNKRPEISTPHNPLHLTHVGFDSFTRKFTGLPEDWQRPLQDSGISKSVQEKDPLSVMEVVEFHQEGDGDVWDMMGLAPAPGSSRSPSIPGAAHAAYPRVSKTVDDGRFPTVSTFPLWFHTAPF
jgi:p21-activated kinase 1